MIYLYIGIMIALVTVFRLIARALLFKNKMDMDWRKGLIPIYSNIMLYKRVHLNRENLFGMIVRFIGVAVLALTLLLQWYESMVAMTHIYGLIFGFYEAANHTTLWNCLSTSGLIIFAFGVVTRLIATKRMSKFFGMNNRLWNAVGMLCPGIYELYLALSKKRIFLMNKSTRDMSTEEYTLYCIICDD